MMVGVKIRDVSIVISAGCVLVSELLKMLDHMSGTEDIKPIKNKQSKR